MQSFLQAPSYAWGMLFVILALAAIIGFGAWALTRKIRPTGPVVLPHEYRRRRTVLVAVERRRGSRAPEVST